MKKTAVFFIYLILFVQISYAETLTVMSYNVENLFDTIHDNNKEDWEFLPKDYPGKNEACQKESSKRRRQECKESDWNETKLNLKLEQIVEVVKGVDSRLPDFLGLVEIENKNVLTMLGSKLGYKEFEMTDSPDNRGVDVGLFYKENKMIKKVSRNELVVGTDYPTRNILEVRFLVNDHDYLTLFVNHWPSLHNPDSARVKAAEVLYKRVLEILKNNPDENIMAMGDFNTIDSNDPHPFKTILYKDGTFIDVAETFKLSPKVPEKEKKNLSSGTYYFAPKDEWNMLDHFFINKNLVDDKGSELVVSSFSIIALDFMKKELKKEIKKDDEKSLKIVLAPKRFNPEESSKEKMGYSDHFPIYVKIDFPEIKKEEVKIPSKKVLKKKQKK